MKKRSKETKKADATYRSQKKEQFTQGAEITHEQATDTLTEGTIDGHIDQLDEDGKLISHEGEELKKVDRNDETK